MTRSISGSTSFIEEVEPRRLFANIFIQGTPGPDVITVSANVTYLTAIVNGVVTNYTGCRTITVSGGTGDDTITLDGGISLGAAISGNSGNDTIVGGGGPDTITGNNGNDSLSGGDDDDYVFGNDGTDYITGAYGTDNVYANDAANTSDGDADSLYEDLNQGTFDVTHYIVGEDTFTQKPHA